MVSPPTAKEAQHSLPFDVKEKHGISRLGLMVNESWNQDRPIVRTMGPCTSALPAWYLLEVAAAAAVKSRAMIKTCHR